jgi:hypothetical protein
MLELEGYTTDQYLTAGIVWFFDEGGDYEKLSVGHPFRSGGKTFAIGPKSARVFETEGTKNYSCHVIYKGAYKVVRGSVTVAAQSSVYNDTNSFYYDPSGTFADEASGASNQYTDAASMKAAIKAYNDDALILLARGQTFTDMGGVNSWRQDTDFEDQKLTFRDYGTGDKPLLSGDKIHVIQAQTVKFLNLRFESGWDASTETGTHDEAIHTRTTDTVDTRVLVHGCDFDGITKATYLDQSLSDGNGFGIISECHITNWQDYGMFNTDDRMAVIGSYICQNVDALGGGDMAKPDDSNNHGPYRSSGARQVWWACEAFSNNGWFQSGGTPSHNPAFRIWSSSGDEKSASIAGCVFEGGSAVVSLDSSAGGSGPDEPKHLRFTSNVLISTTNSYSVITFCYGGTSIDNNILIIPDRYDNENQPMYHWFLPLIDRIDDAEPYSLENIDPAGSAPSNFQRPVHVRNNTLVFTGTDKFSETIYNNTETSLDELIRGEDPVFAGSTWENNYVYAPTRVFDPVNNGDPIDLTSFFAPKYKGFRWSGSTTLDANYATGSGELARYAPATGSSALGAATGNIAELDFFGEIRSASTATGAFDGVVS